MIRTQSLSMLCMTALPLAAVTAVHADAVLTNGDFLRVTAAAFQYDDGDDVFEGLDVHESNTGVDFGATATMAHSDGNGFVASAQSQASWAYDPSSPGLGSTFSSVSIAGSSTLTSSTAAFYNEEIANTGFGMSLYISLDTDTTWSLSAGFQGSMVKTGDVEAVAGWSFRILPGEGPPFPPHAFIDQFLTETGTIDWSINESGVLPAGQYIVIMNVVLGSDYFNESVSSVQAELQLTDGLLTFTPVPSPGAVALLAFSGMTMKRRRR